MRYNLSIKKRTKDCVHDLISGMLKSEASAWSHLEYYSVHFFRSLFARAQDLPKTVYISFNSGSTRGSTMNWFSARRRKRTAGETLHLISRN